MIERIPKRLGNGANVDLLMGKPEFTLAHEVFVVSIVRIGLAETKKFAEGYASIFGSKKKKDDEEKPAEKAKKPTKAGKKKGKK